MTADTPDATVSIKAAEPRWITRLWTVLTAAAVGQAAQYGVPVAVVVDRTGDTTSRRVPGPDPVSA